MQTFTLLWAGIPTKPIAFNATESEVCGVKMQKVEASQSQPQTQKSMRLPLQMHPSLSLINPYDCSNRVWLLCRNANIQLVCLC